MATTLRGQSSWERDWRDSVTKQLAENSDANARTAVTLERLSARWDEHDHRIEALESQPATARANVSAYGGLTLQIIFAGISVVALLISLVSHVSLH